MMGWDLGKGGMVYASPILNDGFLEPASFMK
jgi:hypothetical protein